MLASRERVGNEKLAGLRVVNLYFAKAGIATLQSDLDDPMDKIAVSGFAIAIFLAVFAAPLQ